MVISVYLLLGNDLGYFLRSDLPVSTAGDGGGFGKGGTGTLSVDGKAVDTKHMEHTVPFIFQWDETFDVGMDTGTPVSLIDYHYDVPFRFTGTLNKLTFDLQPQQMTPEEHAAQAEKGQRNNAASQ